MREHCGTGRKSCGRSKKSRMAYFDACFGGGAFRSLKVATGKRSVPVLGARSSPAMLDNNAKPERSWQEIAADAAQEPNPEKLLELSKELEQALDRRRKALHATDEPDEPVPKKRPFN